MSEQVSLDTARALLGVGGGHALVVDFRTGEITSSLPQAELLQRPLQHAEPQRAPEATPWPGEKHTLQVSTLLWGLTHTLVDQGRAKPRDPRSLNKSTMAKK